MCILYYNTQVLRKEEVKPNELFRYYNDDMSKGEECIVRFRWTIPEDPSERGWMRGQDVPCYT